MSALVKDLNSNARSLLVNAKNGELKPEAFTEGLLSQIGNLIHLAFVLQDVHGNKWKHAIELYLPVLDYVRGLLFHMALTGPISVERLDKVEHETRKLSLAWHWNHPKDFHF